MVVNRKPSGTAKSMPAGLAIGWLVELLVTAAACLVLAMLILNGRAGWEAAGYGVMVILLLASYLGAAISCRLVRRRRLLICTLSGVGYLLTLLAAVILLFDGSFAAVWAPAMLIAGGAMAAALIPSGETREKGRRKKRRRY